MTTIEQKVVKAGKYVSTEHVDSIIRNYKKERWIQNSDLIGKEDTLGVWLTADELEEYVQTAKRLGADGIRLCFGVYGETGCRPGMEGKQTVAFVATKSVEEADQIVHRDLYAEKGGQKTLVAYNMFPPLPIVPPTTGSALNHTLGVTLVSDKQNTMRVI